MNNIFQMVSQFKSNPMSLLMRRFNIPQNMNNPQDIVQHLLDSGQISQAQLNNAMRMKNDPRVQQLFKK